MRRSFLVGIVPALAFAAVVSSTKEAKAGPHLDLDLDLGTAFQSSNSNVSRIDFSGGLGARLGYRFNIRNSWVYFQPELGGHYMHFGFNSSAIGYDYAGTVNGGLKVGLQGIVQPNIFGHVGLGILAYNTDRFNSQGYLGPAADIGAGLDFRLLPGFTLGAQVAYNAVTVPAGNESAARWVSFGLTAGFHFLDEPVRPVRRVYVYR
jgi:hypothetical protein